MRDQTLDSLDSLYSYLETEEMKDIIDTIFVTAKMLDYKITIEFQPLSLFLIRIIIKKGKLESEWHDLNFKIDYKHKVLKEIDYYLDGGRSKVRSHFINPDFMKPLLACKNAITK